MILYHGTNADFDEIDLRKSKPNKDFGQGPGYVYSFLQNELKTAKVS